MFDSKFEGDVFVQAGEKPTDAETLKMVCDSIREIECLHEKHVIRAAAAVIVMAADPVKGLKLMPGSPMHTFMQIEREPEYEGLPLLALTSELMTQWVKAGKIINNNPEYCSGENGNEDQERVTSMMEMEQADEDHRVRQRLLELVGYI